MSDKAKFLASAQKNLQKNQLAKAVKDLRKVVEIDPKDIRSRQKLAELLSRVRQSDEALDEYEAVAKYYTENGFYLKAIAVYKQMQKLDPTQVKFYHRLADLNEKQGLLGNALSEYRNLVAYYEKNQMTSEAINVLQKMKDLEPENLNVLVKIAEVYALTGMKDQSRDEFDAVLENLTDKQDFAKIVKLCEMFKRFFPEDPLLPVRSADALIKLGRVEQGVAQLRALPEDIRENSLALQALASGYDKLGRHAEEATVIERLLAQSPADPDLQQRFIAAGLKAGQYHAALATLEGWKDTFLDLGRIDVLQEFYEILNDNLPQTEQVVQTLRAIYEVSGHGDKLFDLMSDGETLPEALERSELETLDDSLLEDAVDDLEELVDADGLTDATAMFAEPADEEEPGRAADHLGEDSEVSLGFLEDVVQEDPAPDGELDETLELELDLDLDLDFEIVSGAELAEDPLGSDVESEEVIPEAELEEVSPEAELEEGVAVPEPGRSETPVNLVFELEEAEFYLQQGLLAQAAAVCRNILAVDPDNQVAHAKLADIAQRERLDESVEEPVRSAPDGESEVSPLLVDEAETDGFDWDAADEETVAQTEDDIDPEDAESHFNLGIAYKEMGLLDDAVNAFATAMRHHSRRFDALLLKGVCLAARGDVELAEQVLAEGLAMPGLNQSERVSISFELGLLKEAAGEPEAALEHLLAAAELDHFFRDVGLKIKHLKTTLGISDAGLDVSLTPIKGKNRVSYL